VFSVKEEPNTDKNIFKREMKHRRGRRNGLRLRGINYMAKLPLLVREFASVHGLTVSISCI